jgi:hypothetical protein
VEQFRTETSCAGANVVRAMTTVSQVFCRGFVDFDLSMIPACARVAAAELRLDAVGWGGSEGTVEVRAVSSDWVADGLTWDTQPPIASDAAASQTARYGDNVWDVTSLVRGWIEDPASNHGLALEPITLERSFRFASSEDTSPGRRPCLHVELVSEE